MQVGQSVVCINDSFPGPLAKYFAQLPVKGTTYTIRAVFIGRGVMHGKSGESDGEIGLLLKELVNGPDPRNIHKQELGFNSERFKPIEELTDSETEWHPESEAVGKELEEVMVPIKYL